MARIEGVVLFVYSVTVVLACGSAPRAVSEGGDCTQATDCAAGLVCVPRKDKTSVCSGDLSGVQKTEPPPVVDAGRADAGDAGGDAGKPRDSGARDAESDATGDATGE